MRHWIVSAMTVATATALGLALGAYATRPQYVVALSDDASAIDKQSDDGRAPDYMINPADHGPGEIRCIGCGPSLADRQRALDMAGLDVDAMIDGTGDRVVRDYLAQGDGPEAAVRAPLPPSPIHQRPEPIARFAAGERATAPPVLQPAQMEAVPATIATAADEPRP